MDELPDKLVQAFISAEDDFTAMAEWIFISIVRAFTRNLLPVASFKVAAPSPNRWPNPFSSVLEDLPAQSQRGDPRLPHRQKLQ